MYCAVNCIENPYIANYIKKRKQIEYEENTNEREENSQYPPIISYDESGNEECYVLNLRWYSLKRKG